MFDSPPPSYRFAVDRGVLSLEAGPRFSVESGALVAEEDATIEVPRLRFRTFVLELDGEGIFSVVLTDEDLRRHEVRVSDGGASVDDCAIARETPLRLVFDGRRVNECLVSVSGRVGISFEVRAGARLVDLALERP